MIIENNYMAAIAYLNISEIKISGIVIKPFHLLQFIQ